MSKNSKKKHKKKRLYQDTTRALMVRAVRSATAKSRKVLSRTVTVIKPGDDGFDDMAAQCTPIREIAAHHEPKSYPFYKRMSRV